MEEKVFRRVAVATELAAFVEARLHTDTADPDKQARFRAMQERLAGSLAQPIYVVLDPRTEAKLGEFHGATLAGDQPFIDFLRRARTRR